MMSPKQYTTFKSFYPYYILEHRNSTSRKLHFIGTFLIIMCLLIGIFSGSLLWFILIPFCGYGFAGVGHFFFEKNKPATFKYPFYSLASDFVMFWHIITGQFPEKLKQAEENHR
ncbi:MAG: DUF962 domain-containing protein [Ginsengibacter sp.]